ASRGDPAADVRRRDPGRDRLPCDRPRDREGAAQGRAREVLRRRHHPQAEADREAEGRQEADEAGRRGRGAPGGVPRGAQPRRGEAVSGGFDGPTLASLKERARAGAVDTEGGLRRAARAGPASKPALAEVERRLGFGRPAVVRDVYGSVANGG